MHILMMTNTYSPHVGGVARSVQSFSDGLRQQGHQVLVVAPIFAGEPAHDPGVLRWPALQHFHHTDFSLPLPAPVGLHATLREFAPQIVHSHHPFLLGDTALRIAAERDLPVVFTHHTMYERYTHNLPFDSARVRRFAAELAAGYCNLCNAVIAPSATIADRLKKRGVKVPIEVIPTGIKLEQFAAGKGAACRRRHAIPADALLLGYLGRLAPEKNLSFLAAVVTLFLGQRPEAHFLMAGEGPERAVLLKHFAAAGVAGRVHTLGVLQPAELADAYRAMDIFVFASQSETQGLVLAEAMAAGTPVVAVDAPGVRDIVCDRENGRLLPTEQRESFLAALAWLADLPPADRKRLSDGAIQTAQKFSLTGAVVRLQSLYTRLLAAAPRPPFARNDWDVWRQRLEEEWKIVHNIAHALGSSRQRPRE